MSFSVIDRIFALFARAEILLCDVSVFVLLLIPVVCSLVWFILRLCSKKCRLLPRRWLLFVSDICLIVFLALVAVAGGGRIFSLFALALVARAVHIALYGLSFLPARDRQARLSRRKKKQRARAEEILDLPALPETESRESEVKPPKVCCFSENDRVVLDKDVRLEHVRSALERLKNMPLGAGDRLESQKMSDLLSVYQAKGELSGKEADTLNDVLASVLKMMAKYDA